MNEAYPQQTCRGKMGNIRKIQNINSIKILRNSRGEESKASVFWRGTDI